MKYLLKQIIEVIDGKCIPHNAYNHLISEVSIDSRTINKPKETIFFALQGEHVNGQQYIPELVRKGVAVIVIEGNLDISKYPNICIILVANVLDSLQQLATWHRHQFEIPIIGITGSNGKTIVKEWLDHLLRGNYNICRSPGSFNSQIGVPLSVLRLDKNHDLGIFEAGISRPDEMLRLAPIIDCEIGVFTHLGDAHDIGFNNRRVKAEEKLKLFDQAKVIIYNSGNKTLDHLIQKTPIRTLTWSTEESSDFIIKNIDYHHTNIRLNVLDEMKEWNIEIPFNDSSSVENAMNCLMVLSHLKMLNNATIERFKTLPKVAMRLELLHGWGGMLVVNDTYSADIESLKVAMKFSSQQAGTMPKYLVISEFVDVGISLIELHHQIVNFGLRYDFEGIVFIGRYDVSWNEHWSNRIKFLNYNSANNFLTSIQVLIPQSLVLLKGARKYKFEQISDVLTKPIEGTRLEIDLTKIKHNLNTYQRALNQDVKIMSMIKASAYGAGFVEMARFLQQEGVDYFGVAYISEGVTLRKEGLNTPILVMNPEPGGLNNLLEYRLEPVIYDFQQIEEVLDTVASLRDSFTLDIHLKINTGMNRLGFSYDEMPELVSNFKHAPKVNIKSIFTHLSATDDMSKDDFTIEQFNKFDKAYNFLVENLGIHPWRHVLNSSGIIAFPKRQMNMVRLGIGLYGLDQRTHLDSPLEISHRFISYVAQVRTINTGEYIGYGANNPLLKKMKVATISAGYADGISRIIGNGSFAVKIRGMRAETVGNICMDMFMVNVTDIENVQRGDEVQIFGNDPSIFEFADSAHTIPYEIISSIGDRVKRLFLYH